MFNEITLRPPARKIKILGIGGAACAVVAVVAFLGVAAGGGGRFAGTAIPLAVVALVCWSQARALAGASLGVRKFCIEIQRRADDPEPLLVEWAEIERIGIAAYRSSGIRGGNSASYIGIRLVDKCSKRHTKTHEKNRRYSDYDILLAGIYGMSVAETVNRLNEKMREATGVPPPPVPVEPVETPASAPEETVVCPKCGEQNPANFSECWKCGHVLKDLSPADVSDAPESV